LLFVTAPEVRGVVVVRIVTQSHVRPGTTLDIGLRLGDHIDVVVKLHTLLKALTVVFRAICAFRLFAEGFLEQGYFCIVHLPC
jgi:hypothetical protein